MAPQQFSILIKQDITQQNMKWFFDFVIIFLPSSVRVLLVKLNSDVHTIILVNVLFAV